MVSLKELDKEINLDEKERNAIVKIYGNNIPLNSYVYELIKKNNSSIRKQFIPTTDEFEKNENESYDFVDDKGHSPVKGLIRKYDNKVVLLVTNKCFGTCRFCYRKHLVNDESNHDLSDEDLDNIARYLEKNKDINEIIITGGDPLTLPNKRISQILDKITESGNIKIIRVATRASLFSPERFDDSLIEILKQHKPVYLMLHINHPDELHEKAISRLAKLSDNGIILLSQTALLKGINDDSEILKNLFTKCVENRIIPYRLYHCDYVPGNSHFRTKVSKGVELLRELQNRISGIAMPIFEVDLPKGKGKLPLNNNYIKKFDGKKYIFESWDGEEVEYFE